MFREFLQRVLVLLISFAILIVMFVCFTFLPSWVMWSFFGLYVVVWVGWPFIKELVNRD